MPITSTPASDGGSGPERDFDSPSRVQPPVPVGTGTASPGAVPVSRVRDLDELDDISARVHAACRRLQTLYRYVRLWYEPADGPDHEELVRGRGLHQLRVLAGRESDGKPPLGDPGALWKRAARLMDHRVSLPTSPLPTLPQFSAWIPDRDEYRRLPEPYALKAAIVATSLLFDDLAECRLNPDRRAEIREGTDAVSDEYDWAAVCERLGDRGESHFGVLEESFREELHAAAAWLTGRSPGTGPEDRGPARFAARGGPVRPDGFGWDGREAFGLTPTPFFLLWELWENLNEPVGFGQLGRFVWKMRGKHDVLDGGTVKYHLTSLRGFLRKNGFPFRIDLPNGSLMPDGALVLVGPLGEGADRPG